MSMENLKKWIVPYIDQPIDFWEQIENDFGSYIQEIYFPLANDIRIGSGRPNQPQTHLGNFLNSPRFKHAVIINPIVLKEPVEKIAPIIIQNLKYLIDTYGLNSITVSNVQLGEKIREKIPDIKLTASVLLDIFHPQQVPMLEGIFDTLVPSSRINRNLSALKSLRQAFTRTIRLIVNEACLPGCPFRTQHFFEMGSGLENPLSLCAGLLNRKPWLRLTGAWILPQHLFCYQGIYDELKLAGRVTLSNPAKYKQVLEAYINRTPLSPHEIGGGPASIQTPMKISKSFFLKTLKCNKTCHACRICLDYFQNAGA